MTEAPQRIKELVERFENNKSTYKNSSYKEEHLRNEFLNVFFKELGWNMDNRGLSPERREVIHGASVRIDGSEREPDYCFAIEGEEKFYIEAKKPSVSIETDPGPAFQLRRYAWTGELHLSILTDFEEFAIYNAVTRPKKDDKARKDRVEIYNYTDYVDKWDEIASIFSKEAVSQGSLDEYIGSLKKKRGEQKVDDEFLHDLESWREELAKNIAIRNSELSVRDLNYSVQKTLDRIVFLRMCEDRSIEGYGQLLKITEEDDIYAELCKIFKKADEKYNSGLFHFKEEENRPTIRDELTLNLNIDDKILKKIIKNLYFPDSPYAFSVLPADILGNAYERFLGKVIRLTPSHRAKIEEKPEVRKAGGVYYTPKYIVDYIVENTVEKLCKGKTPNQISEIKILDPACGSGSFLLGAYVYLLKYHLDYYTKLKDPKRQKNQIYKGGEGEWLLTVKEKKRILLNNIHGVDIDSQAVEVTKLSLLLKVLEGESKDIFEQQQKLFQERALPDLGDNIKCGNSLLGPDFYRGVQTKLFEDEEIFRINAFDWNNEFNVIMDNGGFDAVIGNPPYIRIQTMKEWLPNGIVEFYKKHYTAASRGNYDIYAVFVERALQLLKDKGRMGYIMPHKFFEAKYGQPLRKLIRDGKHLGEVVHFSDQQVFKGATTYTCLLFLDKKENKNFNFLKVHDLEQWRTEGDAIKGKISSDKVTEEEWNFVVGPGADLFNRLTEMPVKLGDISHIFVGLQTSADTVFLFKEHEKINVEITKVYSKRLDKYIELETKLLKPVVRSGNIGRFWAEPTALVLFPYELNERRFQLISESKMKQNFPKTWQYLLENKEFLSEREHGKFKNSGWYQLYPKNLDLWEQPKIMLPYMITELSAYHDNNDMYFVNVTTGGFGITINEQYDTMQYMTGLLNSNLLDWYLKQVSTNFHGGYFAANKQFLVQIPIRIINFNDSIDLILHDKTVKLVEHVPELLKKLSNVKSPNEKQIIQRQIDSVNSQIDDLVYELYGLTGEEIKIVEEAS